MPSWNRLSYRQRLSVHRSEPWGRPEGYRVADAMIEAYQPIHPQEELQIAAVVRAVIRKY